MSKILKSKDFKEKRGLEDQLNAPPSVVLRAPAVATGGIIDKEVLKAGDKAKAVIQGAQQDALKIREEAKALLARVGQEMERAKQEGFEQGKQAGLENALEMLVRVKELRAKLFSDNEKEIVRLVFEIAKKVIGREFNQNDKAIMNVIRLALSDAVGDKIIVRLNPKDYEIIKKNEKELVGAVEAGMTLNFKEDLDVQAGGCVVDTDIGTIDAQLDTQLHAIKKALGL
jgi:flagellar biosynthesis/type III secretory pathway protein FliH